MPLKFPQNVKIWNSLREDIPREDQMDVDDGSSRLQYKKLKSFILTVLSEFKNQTDLKPELLEMLKSFIMLTEKMIILRLYTQYSELLSIFESLKDILVSTDSFL